MITAYWHVYLTNDVGSWAGIVMEQIDAMERSGLIKQINKLKITVISRTDSSHLFGGLIHSIFSNAEIEFVDNPFHLDLEMLQEMESNKAVTENHTLRKIYKDCLDIDQTVLYFHTKGITADMRFLRNGNFDIYRDYYGWRQYLNWGALEQWKSCQYALEQGYDVAGPNYKVKPEPHFSGAFWWTTSKYIRLLPDPSTKDWWYALKDRTTDQWLKTCSDRFRDEMWICQGKDCHAANIQLAPVNPAYQSATF